MENKLVSRKKVNRNPFNEKLVHRYLLEVFYGIHGSNRAVINNLIPPMFHHSTINLVVPEAHLPEQGYRPDLTLFFRGHKEGVPVEIKWSAKKIRTNQLRYLRNKNGILITLDRPDKRLAIPNFQIDWQHFRDWFARSSLRLLRDAFNPEKSQNVGWVVVLRGMGAANNFRRMLAVKHREAFWAFRNNPTSIKSVLELSEGDRLLFLFVSSHSTGLGTGYEGNKLIVNAENKEITILDWYIGEITDPYYMDLNRSGNFFESGKPAINDRRWPHFVGFTMVAKKISKTAERFRRGEFAEPFAISANYGGIPVRVNPVLWEELISCLKATDEP
jgi:hypothetical protein